MRVPYRHEAFFYASQDELIDANVRWLREGLDAGDVIALGCGEDNNARLASALGDHPGVRLLPPGGVYRKAVDAVAFYHDFVTMNVDTEHAGVRVLAEVGFSTGAEGREEWRRYEAVCNQALEPLPLWSVCAYGTAELPQALVDTARLTHPWLRTAAGAEPNRAYVPPAQLFHGADLQPLPPPSGTAATTTLSHVTDLAELRNWLRAHLDDLDATSDVVDNLTFAVNEVAGNGLRHGRPPVEVTLWGTPTHLLCDVTDHGSGIDDPLVGFTPPDIECLAEQGAGLWLTRRLCDEVTVAQGRTDFTVRLTVNRVPVST